MSTEIYVKGSGGGNGLLSALPWTDNHTALTGNPYLVGTLVYDGGNIYKCLANNDGIPTWNPFYWYNLGPGFILAQEKPDWNATSGDSEILNKPTITSGTVTSVDLTMPAAFSVTNNPITSAGTINVTATGTTAQVILGDGTFGTLPVTTGFVPYTGATTDVDLGTHNLTADHIALNVNPSGAGFVVGATEWNNTEGISQTLLTGGNVILKNGIDLVTRVVNKVTPNQTLTKAGYQVVKISGAYGQKLAVDLAQADNDNNSVDTLGVVIENINTNQQGFIMTVGQLLDVNASGSLQGETWVDGDVLYLSPTVRGVVTKVKPTGATGHIVVIGYVEYAHATQGKIYIKIMNGWELDELHNVYINSPLNNNLLTYESTTQLWKNKSLGTVIGGAASQYVRGDGTIASFPDISGGGGGQVYYLNGSVSQGTIGGTAYKQLSTAAITTPPGVDFTSGTIDNVAFANFITDVGKPTQEVIPAGVWIFQCYFTSTSNTTEVYATVEVYDGSTFTVISTSLHEIITDGSNLHLYTFTCAVPEYNPLIPVDRIAIRFYPTNLGGNTITLHTENSHLGSIQTTFTTGVASIDGLTAAAQYLSVGTTGTDFNIGTSGVNTHVFNLPTASASNRGALSTGDWTNFNNKIGGSGTLSYVPRYTASGTIGNSLIQDNSSTVGIGGLLGTSQFYITQNALAYGVYSTNGYATGVTYGGSFRSTAGKAATNGGVEGVASGSTGLNIGVSGIANSSGAAKNYGGSFVAGLGASNYAIRLLDGSEGSGKFLKDVTGNGEARWTNITTSDISGILTGSGTAGYMTRFVTSTILGDSVIQDNGTTLGIGIAPNATYKLNINASGTNTAIYATADNVGIYATADNYDGLAVPIGIIGYGSFSGGVPPSSAIGGYFIASGTSSNYAVQLQDNSEGVGKFLKCITSDGKANWATLTVANTGLTLTTTGTSGAATLVGNTLNIPQYTGAGTLAQVLTNGNSAGTTDINMNNNNITSIATVSANNGPAVQMINMTNAVNMLLMYNS